MRSRFVISESDRRNILSMYGLLTEEEKEYSFSGVVKDEKGEGFDSPYIYIKKESADGKLNSIATIIGDKDGNFEKKINLDNSLKHFFSIEEGGYLVIKQEIDLTKTEQTNLELILKKRRDVIDLEETKSINYQITTIEFNVFDKNKNPLNDFDLKIFYNDNEVINKKFTESKINLHFLKNDLLLEDLEKDKYYEYKPTESNFFNASKKNEIRNYKFVVSKNEYEDKIINYDIKVLNSYVEELPTKETNDGYFISYQGTEKIKINEGFENIIDFELSKPPLNNINKITGQLKVKGPLSNLIDGPKNLTIELYAYKKESDKIYEPILLKKTITVENGYFNFNISETLKLSDFEYFEILFDGEGSFGSFSKKILVKDIATNPIVIETGDYSVGEIVLNDSENPDENKNEDNLPIISSYCKNYKTTKRKIYGLGVSENISNDDALNMAVRNAIKSFTTYYPKYEILDYLLLNDPKIYKIVCNKATKQKREIVVRLVPKELKKYAEYKEVVEVPSIKFRNLDFTDAVYRSFESKRKIFLIFTGTDKNSSEVLKKLNSNIDIINLLNENYINLNYDVNIANKEKYLIASNSLEIYTYPYVVVLEGVKNPETASNLEDSYRVLKKYGMKNDLMNLNVGSF